MHYYCTPSQQTYSINNKVIFRQKFCIGPVLDPFHDNSIDLKTELQDICAIVLIGFVSEKVLNSDTELRKRKCAKGAV